MVIKQEVAADIAARQVREERTKRDRDGHRAGDGNRTGPRAAGAGRGRGRSADPIGATFFRGNRSFEEQTSKKTVRIPKTQEKEVMMSSIDDNLRIPSVIKKERPPFTAMQPSHSNGSNQIHEVDSDVNSDAISDDYGPSTAYDPLELPLGQQHKSEVRSLGIIVPLFYVTFVSVIFRQYLLISMMKWRLVKNKH